MVGTLLALHDAFWVGLATVNFVGRRITPFGLALIAVALTALVVWRKPRAQRPEDPVRPLLEWRDDVSVLETPEAFGYHVYTQEFDEVVSAIDLVSPGDFSRLSEMLKISLEQHSSGIVAPASPSATAGREPGAVITLLLDNSGSMRGLPVAWLASLIWYLVPILEQADARVEVIGFTTSRWKGGRSRENWLAQGKPQSPGRLTDLRYIIYKSADEPWETAKNNLAVMPSLDVLKENVDGEAIVWAYQRLIAEPEGRRVLVVVSDGASVDDSTLSVNSGDYLERHLRHVIRDIERTGKIELCAIGIGHPVDRYYARAKNLGSDTRVTAERLQAIAAFICPPPDAAVGPSATQR